MSDGLRGAPSWFAGFITRIIRLEGLRSSFDNAGMVRPDKIPAQVKDASALTYTPTTLPDWTGSVDPGDVNDALDQLAQRETDAEAALVSHLVDITDAHDASAVSVADVAGNFVGTDVEAVLAELVAAGGSGGDAVATYLFAPDAAPTGTISAGNQQGNIYHSGPNIETATKLLVDCKTAPGAAGLPITIQYGDTDSLDTVSVWTDIGSLTLSSAKSANTTTFTNATIPANRLIRMNIGTIVGTPSDANISLVVHRPVVSLSSVVQYTFAPDATPGATIVVGNGQGNIFHSGPANETATKLYVDCETAPGAAGLPITIQYGDTDSMDTVSAWTTIATVTLSSAKSINTTTMTNATIPANRVMRMNVGTIVGTPADATIILEADRPTA